MHAIADEDQTKITHFLECICNKGPNIASAEA